MIAAALRMLLHWRDFAHFVEIHHGDALVDAPAAIALRPLVDIAAPGGYLHVFALALTAQCRGDIGLAAGPVAVQLDDDVRDLVRMGIEVLVRFADPVDEAFAGALKNIRAIVGGAVLVPDGIALFVVHAVHRAAIAIDQIGDGLPVGGGFAAGVVAHAGSFKTP